MRKEQSQTELTKQKGEEFGGIAEGYHYIRRFHKNLVYSCHMTRCVFRIIIQVNAQHHYCGDLMTLITLILKSSTIVDHQLLESTDVYIAMSAWKLSFTGNAYMITTTAHPV